MNITHQLRVAPVETIPGRQISIVLEALAVPLNDRMLFWRWARRPVRLQDAR